jgi:hypothetical protein
VSSGANPPAELIVPAEEAAEPSDDFRDYAVITGDDLAQVLGIEL